MKTNGEMVARSFSLSERSEMAVKIRKALSEKGLTQVWLILQLQSRGVCTDKSEFSSILSGVRTGAKADKVLSESLEILK